MNSAVIDLTTSFDVTSAARFLMYKLHWRRYARRSFVDRCSSGVSGRGLSAPRLETALLYDVVVVVAVVVGVDAAIGLGEAGDVVVVVIVVLSAPVRGAALLYDNGCCCCG